MPEPALPDELPAPRAAPPTVPEEHAPSPAESFVEVAEPMSEQGGEQQPYGTERFEADLRSLGLGELSPQEMPQRRRPIEEMTIGELEAISRGETPPPAPQAPPADVVEGGRSVEGTAGGISERAEIQELISTLEEMEEAGEAPPIADVEELASPVADRGDAEGQGVSMGPPPTGVISTDAFLADISAADAEGSGFTGGLSDEITALTGAESAKGRPAATVNRIPERDESGVTLHRDQMVDKTLLLRIIEGIKDL